MGENKKPSMPDELGSGSAVEGAQEDDTSRVERARLRYHEFRAWLRANPWVADKMKDWARSRAVAGQRVASKHVIEELRNHDIVAADGRDARLSNDYGPLIGRWLVREVPEVEPHIVLRKSVFDRVELFSEDSR